MIPDSIKKICADYSEDDSVKVVEAYNLAAQALKGRIRSNNHPFLEHVIGVAHIVSVEIGLDAQSTAAVFLHEASRDNPALLESYTASDTALALAAGLNKISQIKPRDTMLEADRYRKLIASYSTDPRVFIIKLADRLEVMRTLHIFPKADQARKNAETMLLYIPLAHQAGLYNIKSELEDLWLRYANPESWRAITNYLKATAEDRNALVESFIKPLEATISARGIKYHLKARTKSAYSIWKKMQVQNIPIGEVYDVFAIRFIVDVPPEKEISTCWDVFALVTENYPQDERRLRQWLDRPKPNGYQSLHCTVNVGGQWVEVQIRSERMDYEAELGGAAHWSYKGVKRDAVIGEWLQTVRSLMESPDHATYQDAAENLLEQDVFVFTPDGELRQLKAGSCVLDFAFDIHSNLGLRCTGGRINGKMVSIREPLKTGDQVEILTSKNQKPNEDWLNFVVTSKARTKIKQKLKERENALAKAGKDILDRRLKNWKMTMADEQLTALIKKYKFRTANELFGAIGEEKIDMAEIKAELLKEAPAPAVSDDRPVYVNRRESGKDYLEIGGNRSLSGVEYKMAKCCNPVYGDDVFGFVTINEGIKIHRLSCPNAARLIENYPHRVQKVRWKKDAGTSSSQVALKIIIDEESAVNDVLTVISSYHALVRKLLTGSRNKRGEIEIDATIFVSSNLMLDKILAGLRKLKNVRQVARQ
ncbi:MAG: bifunctional (p)ppGpp synthetase/guanosine-3',5'-bis(diphosphate) 3'-pyrophosphohydrolase [Bacteroidales bacterium]|nr:bifunctional (p)ppGpp synthetase/guanosine-3',5'-bis(diphosphate) 3'-pyrophosphohydrolase [Bacteroidales bacterium]MBQ9530147.1 bifunctional (p)ppGpp synthetase/guanosine-3',5'-bis(diphosphate) 3'-pyrophosphohydrolase [Bacteroidales bacterium]